MGRASAAWEAFKTQSVTADPLWGLCPPAIAGTVVATMRKLLLLVFACLVASCGTVPTTQESPPSSLPAPTLAFAVDGLWYLSSVTDPGQGVLHLFGEPFRDGSMGFVLSVKDQFTQCVSDDTALSLADGADAPTVYKRALGTRPVTVDDTAVTMRFTMGFEPTWYDVYDELRNERTVEFRITGTRVPNATGLDVFDVSVERFFVVSGYSIRGTGTLSHFPVEAPFECE